MMFSLFSNAVPFNGIPVQLDTQARFFKDLYDPVMHYDALCAKL